MTSFAGQLETLCLQCFDTVGWSLASVKSRLVLPFWYRLTWVVPEKGLLNVCVCVCVCFHDNWLNRYQSGFQ